MAGGVVQPAKIFLGPPPPAGTAWLARATMIALVIVVGHWVHAYLGGVSTSPTPTDPITGANDTKQLFNWHPVLMTLAFGVFMAEAVITYSAPLVPNIDRATRKKIHASLHGVAALCAVVGVTAAFKSHSLALPTPMPDLYSPHSFLGLMVLVMLGLQIVVGFGGYLWPQFSLPSRLALGPLHKFSGKLVWVAGLAAMATGLQEKTTFTQLGRNLSGDGLYGPVIRLPATAQLLLVLLAALVLFHQVPAAKALDEDRASRLGLLTGNASEEGYTQA